jgi:hypothetical protein
VPLALRRLKLAKGASLLSLPPYAHVAPVGQRCALTCGARALGPCVDTYEAENSIAYDPRQDAGAVQ